MSRLGVCRTCQKWGEITNRVLPSNPSPNGGHPAARAVMCNECYKQLAVDCWHYLDKDCSELLAAHYNITIYKMEG